MEGWQGAILLVWVVLLSAAYGVFLYFWWQSRQRDADMRETLIYRLTHLEARLRQQEEVSKHLSSQARLWEEMAARSLAPSPVLFAEEEAVSQAIEPQISPTSLEIIERHQRGQSVLLIAQEMGLGQGEVQLILSLEGGRKRR